MQSEFPIRGELFATSLVKKFHATNVQAEFFIKISSRASPPRGEARSHRGTLGYQTASLVLSYLVARRARRDPRARRHACQSTRLRSVREPLSLRRRRRNRVRVNACVRTFVLACVRACVCARHNRETRASPREAFNVADPWTCK
ncbi:hypothetical protein ALC62_01456 [Cyphomyrmex costatus]|uniref:Uncharacterized protein n=1 Tax=Cyphomyrmex costatus TaxID=456900 RepID=A0A195D475_9HYME|nr:hypothetical protein ALC62_01456 [Cyphomyrmex costatus]